MLSDFYDLFINNEYSMYDKNNLINHNMYLSVWFTESV